jgi:hypothetical protein
MAGAVRPGEPLPPTYRGVREIFEFTNWDGRHTRFNCGQAAACTFLTHYHFIPPRSEAMQSIEHASPPDNFGGYLGTSRRCVEHICRSHGLLIEGVVGENELRWHIGSNRPVIVMLGVSGPKFLRWQLPAGHWMVAYGFDDEHIYLTNWGKMKWDEFRAGWQSIVPRLIQMRESGLVLRVAA